MMLVTRAEWGAAPPKGPPVPWDGYRAPAAHYVGPNMGWPWEHARCAGIVRGIQRDHLTNRNASYNDIAYTALACGHGYVFEGRGPRVLQGANGTSAANRTYYSICVLIGADDAFTDPAKEAFVDAAEWLGVAGGGWRGHRDFVATSCPGGPIYEWVHTGHARPGSVVVPVPSPDPFQLRGRMALVTLTT